MNQSLRRAQHLPKKHKKRNKLPVKVNLLLTRPCMKRVMLTCKLNLILHPFFKNALLLMSLQQFNQTQWKKNLRALLIPITKQQLEFKRSPKTHFCSSNLFRVIRPSPKDLTPVCQSLPPTKSLSKQSHIFEGQHILNLLG